MGRFSTILTAGLLALGLANPATGASVFLIGDGNTATNLQDNEVFYQNILNGQSVLNATNISLGSLGTTAVVSSGLISSATLAGKSFLLAGLNVTSYSATQLASIASFVTDGGSLLLIGEGNPGFSSTNTALNSILAAVGSTMSLSLTENFDNGFHTTLQGLTTATPFTAGVGNWTTAFAAKINLGAQGQAIISGVADNGFGVAVAYENMAATLVPVPVPATGLLLIGALGGLGVLARQRRRRAA